MRAKVPTHNFAMTKRQDDERRNHERALSLKYSGNAFNSSGMDRMVLAFVCVKIGSGEQQSLHRAVLEGIKKIPGVLEVHLMFGRYDAIAKVEAKDTDSLSTLIVDKIGSVNGVLWTETFVTHS